MRLWQPQLSHNLIVLIGICLSQVLGHFLGRKLKLFNVSLPEVTKLRGTSQDSNQNSSPIQELPVVYLTTWQLCQGEPTSQTGEVKHGNLLIKWVQGHRAS